MANNSLDILISVCRGTRLVLHIFYGMWLAIFYPYFNQTRQRCTLKIWSKQLLAILNIDIQTEGHPPTPGGGGCMIVANHVSWLDIFVLNAIHPSNFIAKSEVRDWPIIGWLSRRSGTIFIERAFRRNASLINKRVSVLLGQGACIGLFPEGTTTDGKQVGHFHSALIQPAIDAGVMLCPIALCYQNNEGGQEIAATFMGNMTLVQSIWKILRCPHHYALVRYTPALMAGNTNRRVLARTAQDAIAQVVQTIGTARHTVALDGTTTFPKTIVSSQSSYALLIDPLLNQIHR